MFFLWTALVFIGACGVAYGVEQHRTTWDQWHHLYYVPVLFALGAFVWSGFGWIGCFVALDDGCEHTTAAVLPSHQAWSPIYTYLLPLVWKIPGIPAIAAWLNALVK